MTNFKLFFVRDSCFLNQTNSISALTPDQAMRKYVELVNSLDTFGACRFFVRSPRGNEIISVNGDGLTQIDAQSRNVMGSWSYAELAGWNAKEDLLQIKVATGVLKWVGPDVHVIVALLSDHVAFKVRQTQAPPKTNAKQAQAEDKDSDECSIM